MIIDVQTVMCDGWESLYINGELYGEGHHVRIDDFCTMINKFIGDDSIELNGINYKKHWVREDYVETSGLPRLFKDNPESVFE